MPEDAWRVESLRRQIMDSSYRCGYELVMPPLIEYLDSLLTGTGEMLDLQTFKIIDQHNGRTLGIRADMTPQVARIDAHALSREQPNRLFYTGSVLRARTDGAGGSRTPLQFGAELFGHAGPGSDVEIIQLMLDTVLIAGLQETEVLLDVGHVGVFRGLINNAGLSAEEQEQLFSALLSGSHPQVQTLLESSRASDTVKHHFQQLSSLRGDSNTVLAQARLAFADAGTQVEAALNNLQQVIASVHLSHPGLTVHLDLAELRGYRYHTGMLFALYDLSGSELARGGRYDAIGELFGRARPATGFSGDLIKLALAKRQIEHSMTPADRGIWVNQVPSAELWQYVRELRAAGERVVFALQDSTMSASSCRCERELVYRDGNWIIEPL